MKNIYLNTHCTVYSDVEISLLGVTDQPNSDASFEKLKVLIRKIFLKVLSPHCAEYWAPPSCLHFNVSFFSSVTNLLHCVSFIWTRKNHLPTYHPAHLPTNNLTNKLAGVKYVMTWEKDNLFSLSTFLFGSKRVQSVEFCENFSYLDCGASEALHQIHHKTKLDIFVLSLYR